ASMLHETLARLALCVWEGVPADRDTSVASRISSRATPMSDSRSFRSLVRHRLNRRCTDDGVDAGSVGQSGSPRTTAARISVMLSPGNAIFPVSISKSTQPNAQMSVRLSTGFPFACSGDIYAAVPRISPCCETFELKVGLRRVGELPSTGVGPAGSHAFAS